MSIRNSEDSAQDETVENFRQLIVDGRKKSSSRIILNHHPWHCLLAFEELLNLANSRQHRNDGGKSGRIRTTVRCLTSGLPDYFFGEGQPPHVAMKSFLHAGGKLRVILWRPKQNDKVVLNQDELGFRKLCNEFKQAIICQSPPSIEGCNEMNQLFLVDDIAYRIQQYYSQQDIGKSPRMPARLSFKDVATARMLVDGFDAIFGGLALRSSV